MVQVVWSHQALADLAAIRSYIRLSRPMAAERMARRLIQAGYSLADHPDRGRPAGRYRELVAVSPYVIRYRTGPSGVVIVRLKHAAQRPG